MKHTKKNITLFLLLTFVIFNFACQKQQSEAGKNQSPAQTAQTVKAQSPTEAYKMLFAAVKAKDTATIKQLMSKGSLGLAEFNANNQKITLEKSLENGLVAPTLSPTLTEIRDERIKDNFGAIEVFNAKDNRWEDLPFVLEDGSWKLAVGDLFQDTFKSPGKSKGQIEREASNTMTTVPTNTTNFPEASNGNKSIKTPPATDGTKSVEVPKEDKPKK